MRTSWRAVAWFVVRFTSAFGALLWAWPWVREHYVSAMVAVGNELLPQFDRARLTFSAVAPEPGKEHEFPMLLLARLGSGDLRFPIDLRSLAFIPSVTLLALAAATPVWRTVRGPVALLTAFTMLQLFLVLSIGGPLLLVFAAPAQQQLIELSPTVSAICDVLYRALVAPPGMSYAVPGSIWLLTLWIVPEPGLRDGTASDNGAIHPEHADDVPGAR